MNESFEYRQLLDRDRCASPNTIVWSNLHDESIR
jgi:hypothetical protein